MTEDVYAVQTLDIVKRVGLLGDLHGNMEHALISLDHFRSRGIKVILQLGDASLIWPGEYWHRTLSKLGKRLARNRQTFYFLSGNHDWHPRIAEFPIAEDGVRWIRGNIAHLPNGFRTTLAHGLTFGVLGGAASVDRDLRTEGRDWWASEVASEAELQRLGHDHVDILAGHDAPFGLKTLDDTLAKKGLHFSDEMLDYANAGRAVFHRGFMNVSPSLYLGAHYHALVDEHRYFGEGADTFPNHTVLLDRDGKDTASLGILTLAGLRVETFTRNGTVLDLPGLHAGGVWDVYTRDSRHRFDLDYGCVTRYPGTSTYSGDADGLSRRLRSIERCRVGERGLWTFPGSYLIDYEWHSSSVVQRIERVDFATDSVVVYDVMKEARTVSSPGTPSGPSKIPRVPTSKKSAASGERRSRSIRKTSTPGGRPPRASDDG